MQSLDKHCVFWKWLGPGLEDMILEVKQQQWMTKKDKHHLLIKTFSLLLSNFNSEEEHEQFVLRVPL